MNLPVASQPPAKALAQVLGLFDPEWFHSDKSQSLGQGNVFTYSASFAELWGFDNVAFKGKLAIVWDGAATTDIIGTVDLEPHLSPLTWATHALKTRQELEIFILDLAPNHHRPKTRLHRFIEAVQPNKMPWLRVVSLTEFGRFLVNHYGHDEVPNDTNKNDVTARNETLGMLWRQIRAELTESGHEGDHHAIQNIVGPLVLLGDDYLATKGPSARALKALFSTVGLIEFQNSGEKAPSQHEDWPIQNWGEEPIRLLLVDDQWRDGWADWVSTAIPSAKRQSVRVQTTDGPNIILEGVRRSLETSTTTRDARFRLTFDAPRKDGSVGNPPPNQVQTILLLDLRLFAQGAKMEEEVRFYQDALLPLCERYVENGAGHFAWPGFTSEELNQVRQWCADPQRKRNSADHLLALTFLPRLVALVDMALPIIIFSSTGQRCISEWLKPYGNIITTFEKPRFMGRGATDAIIETRANFCEAIRTARQILVARMAACAAATSQRIPTGFPLVSNPSISDVDVFIDESGESQHGMFSLGAAILLYPSDHAKRDFVKALASQKLTWGVDEISALDLAKGTQPPNHGDCLPKRYRNTFDYEPQLQRIDKIAGDCGITIIACGFQGCGAESRYLHFSAQDFGLSPDFGDTVYRVMLGEFIESCLFGPFWFLSTNTARSVSLQTATRLGSVPENQMDLAVQYMGLKFSGYKRDNRAFFYSVGGSDILPLVIEVIEMHPKAEAKFKFARVRGATLYDFDELRKDFQDKSEKAQARYSKKIRGDMGPLPESLHFLADWVAHFALLPPRDVPPTARIWFERGFLQERNTAFRACLAAMRSADTHEFATALAQYDSGELLSTEESQAPNAFASWTSLRAKDWCERLDGRAFLRMARMLEQTR
ncbi:MAG: hypothetical protein C4586_07655 [Anaerolineaceae bacterium]|nr:MAG: hypothetical protein C4586_07655 [Anaerolineaceae bacterium]